VDENFYASTVRDLLSTADEDQYLTMFADMAERWSPLFREYYVKNIAAAVLSSAVYAIRHLDVLSVPYLGITNNVSESYNRVLKDFQNWKVRFCIQIITIT